MAGCVAEEVTHLVAAQKQRQRERHGSQCLLGGLTHRDLTSSAGLLPFQVPAFPAVPQAGDRLCKQAVWERSPTPKQGCLDGWNKET